MKPSSIIVAVGIFAGIAVVGGGLALVKYRMLHPAGGGAAPFELAQAVQVVTAKEVSWQPTADLVGTVFSLRSIRVCNELAGKIKEVRFESGGVVEADQVLFTLDDSSDRADLAAAEASIRVAESNLAVAESRTKLAETELRRRSDASHSSAIAEVEVDRANSELDKARADHGRFLAEVDLAKAHVAQVKARVDKLTIKAPFRGKAGMRTVHEGQYLAEGEVVVMLEEVADKIYLDFAIPQEYLARVHAGTVVMATSALFGPNPVKIEVVALDATVNNDTRNVRVRSIVNNPGALLQPGMFVQIQVPADEAKRYVMVPSTAVRRNSYADQVFVVVPERAGAPGAGETPEKLRAKQRFVKLGPAVGENVIVLDGLKAGESIAADGSFKLRDGSLLRQVATEAAPTPDPEAHASR